MSENIDNTNNIVFLEKEYPNEEIFYSLNPIVRLWYKLNFLEPSPPQKYSIVNILKKKNSLISSPTGSGKTLSAFLSIISELVTYQSEGNLNNQVYCVYISPLKALANDIEKNLNTPLNEMNELLELDIKDLKKKCNLINKQREKGNNNLNKQKNKKGGESKSITEINLISKQDIEEFIYYKNKIEKINIRAIIRTGDTSTYEKTKMLKNPPHILITTPESFAITLASKKFKENLKSLEWLVVDEIHALADGKRGVMLSLSMELLNSYKEFTRIGLSATVSPLVEVAKFLSGLKINDYNHLGDKVVEFRNCDIIDVQYLKKNDLKVITPVKNLIMTSSEELIKKLYKQIHSLIQKKNITLIFTNTRAGTERVINQLKTIYPKFYNDDNVGAHHGSLSKEERTNIENKLKEGKIKLVVSSTSLELGIDIGNIDQVLLLGSPKSVARALQRVGRSGHSLHDVSFGRIIPLDRDDLVETSVLLKDALEKKIDKIQIIKNSLDVLAQTIFGFVIDEPKTFLKLKEIIYKSYSYSELNKDDLLRVLLYLEGTSEELEARHVYGKIWWDRETGIIKPRGKLARIIYLTNLGTIPDQTGVKVKIEKNIIGSLDEGFLEKLKKGDVFTLGGKTYVFLHARGMSIQVRPAPNLKPTIPNWYSEQLPLSFELANSIQNLRYEIYRIFKTHDFINNTEKESIVKREAVNFLKGHLYSDENTASSIFEYMKEQYLYAILPTTKNLVIETYTNEKEWKKYFIFHSMNGRRVNDVLSRAIGALISKTTKRDSEILTNDNSFAIVVDYNLYVNFDLIFSNLKTIDLYNILKESLKNSEVLRRRFRHCATRSLMILKNYMGRKKNVGRQQISSMFLLKTVRELGDDFPILKEAYREVLEDLMDIKNAQIIIDKLKDGFLRVDRIETEIPSPFSFNLVLQGNFDVIKVESKQEFLQRYYNQILAKIELKKLKK